jgi:hypothetical protein
MWNEKPDGYPIPARNLRVRVRIFTHMLFAGGRVIALPDSNLTRYHPYPRPYVSHVVNA